MAGMIRQVGDRKFILQGRANPEAAYDAVGVDGARGSETVSQILAWAEENLTRDEKQVLAEELSGASGEKTKRVLDLLAARLTPQELAAVAKILYQTDDQESYGSTLSEDARIRWKSADHYRIYHNALNMRAAKEGEKQDEVERREREYRRQKAAEAEKEFRERYPDAPKVDPYHAKPRVSPKGMKIAHDTAEFYERFPDAKRIGHM